jgi:hypothetical protein
VDRVRLSGYRAVYGQDQQGHIQRLLSGSFRVKVYAGTDPVTGKERLLTSTASTHVMRAAGQCETIAPRGRTRATTAAALTPAGR